MRLINSKEKSENPRMERENYIGIIVRLLNTFWITEHLEERQRVDLIERVYYINVIYVLFGRESNVLL